MPVEKEGWQKGEGDAFSRVIKKPSRTFEKQTMFLTIFKNETKVVFCLKKIVFEEFQPPPSTIRPDTNSHASSCECSKNCGSTKALGVKAGFEEAAEEEGRDCGQEDNTGLSGMDRHRRR